MRMLGLLLVLVVIGSIVWFLMKNRVSRTHQQVRDRALQGGVGRAATARPANKHLAMMGRTLTIAGEPEQVGNLVVTVAQSDDRVTDVQPDEGSVTIRIDQSRPLVRAHLLPGRTVVGVDEFTWEMGFPQGAPVWDRVADAISQAATAQGLSVSEGEREFARARPGDGPEVWEVRS